MIETRILKKLNLTYLKLRIKQSHQYKIESIQDNQSPIIIQFDNFNRKLRKNEYNLYPNENIKSITLV